MTGNDLNYADILRRWKRTREQAANDLERYLLRGELPDPGSVARAIVTLRSELEPVAHAHWEQSKTNPKWVHCSACEYEPPDDGGIWEAYDSNTNGVTTFCPECGAKMDGLPGGVPLPIEDSVPVIRCRDCCYSVIAAKDPGCLICMALDRYTKPDGYCHQAEKKEEVEE